MVGVINQLGTDYTLSIIGPLHADNQSNGKCSKEPKQNIQNRKPDLRPQEQTDANDERNQHHNITSANKDCLYRQKMKRRCLDLFQ